MEKGIDWVVGIRTRDSRMVGADESTKQLRSSELASVYEVSRGGQIFKWIGGPPLLRGYVGPGSNPMCNIYLHFLWMYIVEMDYYIHYWILNELK